MGRVISDKLWVLVTEEIESSIRKDKRDLNRYWPTVSDEAAGKFRHRIEVKFGWLADLYAAPRIGDPSEAVSRPSAEKSIGAANRIRQNFTCRFFHHPTRETYLFVDSVSGRDVDRYRCSCGRTFMANPPAGPLGFRVWNDGPEGGL